ncbi:MAG: PQQ-dependent sugar dehydrogenase, partial [Gemmatimonadota bacterium]|nr:PQQ-dependent sugar dehydrogenase [Gemmatimonadota bacterium]
MFRKLAAVTCLPAALACAETGLPSGPGNGPPTGLEADFNLPDGFRIEEFARDVTRPRSLALGDDGTVYVGTYFFTAGLTSPVYALIDREGDYRVDEIREIRNGWGTPNGVDYHDGSLFVSNEHQVWRIDDIDSTLDNPQPHLLFDGLPTRAETAEATDVGHFWRYLRYGPDDRLYVPVGTRWSFLVGAHTANDLNDDWRYSTIVRMDPDGSNVEVFATGVRNSLGMDFHPSTGDLYFTDNGASWPFSDPRFYDIPPDEVNRATGPGQDFGFPYVHGRLPDPLIGASAPGGLVPPVYEFEGHTAPLGMRFYTGDMFPPEYQGAIFVAEHGTEPTTPTTSRSQVSGDRISVIRLGPDGTPNDYEVFASIVYNSNSAYRRRPVDLLVMP